MCKPEPFDVFLLNVPLNKSSYPRPGIIVKTVTDDVAEVVQLSTAFDLFVPQQHFLIDMSASEFQATGLRYSSYVAQAASTRVSLDHFVKRLGRLEGDLARDFKEWFGL